jgi:predicted sulfurtransferase
VLSEDERLPPEELSRMMQSGNGLVVVDVRQTTEYQMCSIPGSVNIPLPSLARNVDTLQRLVSEKRIENNPVVGKFSDTRLVKWYFKSKLKMYRAEVNLN